MWNSSLLPGLMVVIIEGLLPKLFHLILKCLLYLWPGVMVVVIGGLLLKLIPLIRKSGVPKGAVMILRFLIGDKKERIPASLVPWLKRMYSRWETAFVSRGEHTYPVVFFPSAKKDRANVEAVLGGASAPTDTTDPKEFLTSDKWYGRLVSIADRWGKSKKINHITFTMRSLETNDDGTVRKLICEKGLFFEHIDTCASIDLELRIVKTFRFLQFLSSANDKYDEFLQKLKLRKRLPPTIDPIINGKGRSAAIGISTLVAMKTGTGYDLVIRQKGVKGSPLYAGCKHVVPSMMFEVVHGQPELEFSVTHNILREYVEEFFSVHGGEHPNWVDQQTEVCNLQKLLNEKTATLYFTGVAVSLLDLRPEICALLVIDDVAWCEEVKGRWEFNDEYLKEGDFKEVKMTAHDQVTQVSLLDDDVELLKKARIFPDCTVPQGAAAFWAGVDQLRRHINPQPPPSSEYQLTGRYPG